MRSGMDNALGREVLLTGSVAVRDVGSNVEVAAPVFVGGAVRGVVVVSSSNAMLAARGARRSSARSSSPHSS